MSHTLPAPADEMTVGAALDQAHRFGMVIITNGNAFEYALPNQVPAGWRVFTIVDRDRTRDAMQGQR